MACALQPTGRCTGLGHTAPPAPFQDTCRIHTHRHSLAFAQTLGQIEGMRKDCPLLVFSDLDGTLIDHHSYEWSPARPAIDALRKLSAGIVLASSKTAPEIHALRADMGLQDWPAIVENGAGILPARATTLENAPQYRAIRAALAEFPEDMRALFTGFGDMSIEEIMQATGLPRDAAELARQRSFSEPGLWRGTPAQQAAFQQALSAKGISSIEGGRFLTLSFGHDKVQQMRVIIEQIRPAHTIALGDAPNDMQMVQAADFGVIIANPARTALPLLAGEAEGRILRTKEAGPVGWNTAILDLLKKLDLGKD